MRRLHADAAPFANDYRVFDMIDEYQSLLASKSAPMPDGFDEVQADAEVGRAALLGQRRAGRAVSLRPAVRELPRHRLDRCT